jgi:hypothetical protein
MVDFHEDKVGRIVTWIRTGPETVVQCCLQEASLLLLFSCSVIKFLNSQKKKVGWIVGLRKAKETT